MKQWSSPTLSHPLPVYIALSRDFLVIMTMGGWMDGTGIKWVGISDAAENSTVHRAVSISKNYPAQSVNSANVGKHFNEVCNAIISIILMRKVRHREAKALSLDYSGSNC